MKTVGLEVKNLLDKLYNFKSEESSILEKLNSDIKSAIDNKVKTTSEKESLSLKINELENEQVLLTEEGELLRIALGNVNKSSFNVVLNKIGIEFNPGDLCFEVDKNLPETINRIKLEKESSIDKLSEVEKNLNDCLLLIDELDLKKEDALSNQSKLKEYFDLAMKGNVNTTRDNLTNLLDKFGLEDEEKREAAKILMFPEDYLYDYESNYKPSVRTGKSFSDVFKEAKVETPNIIDLTEKIEPSYNPIEEDIPAVDYFDFNQLEVDNSNLEVSAVDVKNLLEKNGLDYNSFNGKDISFLEKNIEETLLEKNVNLIKNMGMNNDIFVENIELLIDDELEPKLNLLIEVGKLPFDIYLNPNILIKYDANELKGSIDSLKESGLDPKKVPLMAY